MAKFNLYLDTRVEKKGGLYNLTIRVNVGNEQFFLIISKMTIVQHHNIFVKTSMDKASIEFRETCTLYINKCEKIYRGQKQFNKDEFRTLFFKKEEESNNTGSLFLSDLFDQFINENKSLKPKTQKHFQYTRNVFSNHSPNINVLDINPAYINQFVKTRTKNNVTQSAIDSSLRDLRRIINYFSNENCVIPSSYRYPFGKGGYSIQNFFPRKLVMSNDNIKSIIELKEFSSEHEEYAKNIWEILYRCNGINFADLLRMRWDNIKGDYLIFFRKKTETTRKNNKKEIVVPLSNELLALFERVGKKHSPFIIGKLNEGYADNTFENKSKKMSKQINKDLKSLGTKLGITIPLKLKTARDAYATSLRRAGVSKDDIGEMLGHSNSIVTEHYLASIDLESTKAINQHLL